MTEYTKETNRVSLCKSRQAIEQYRAPHLMHVYFAKKPQAEQNWRGGMRLGGAIAEL